MSALSPEAKSDLYELLKKIWKNKHARVVIIVLFLIFVGLWYLREAVNRAVFRDPTEDGSTGVVHNDDLSPLRKISDPKQGGNNVDLGADAVIMGLSTKKVTDFTNWKNYQKFDPPSDDNQILYPAFNDFFPEGRTMYSPFIEDSRFKATLIFKPSSVNRGNVVFEFEKKFRCIIGNGNYQHIDCQSPPYGTESLIEQNQKQQHAWINRPSGIKPATTLFLTVITEPVSNSELLNIRLDLKFISATAENGQYKTEHFEYNIPTGEPAEQLQGRIGLGIIDPEKYRPYQPDEAGAEFISLELEP